ncbi:MAG: sugar phosphate isomerase/epimerase [Bryobacterales bacterium]|nr:sugar phosphate isomerase/epimerase [Bryobacterales bacterium]
MHRRQFLSSAATASAAAAAASSASASSAQTSATAPIKLGLDLFSVRDQGWSAFQMLDYAARHRVKHVQFSVTRFYGQLDAAHLRKVRAHADSLGIRLETGMDSICPTSTRFPKDDGTAEQQLLRQLETAKIVGSPIVRCYLGSMADRRTELSFEQHIDSMLAVLKAVRSRFIDAGVKVAIENHAGDFRAQRLRRVIEEAGKDWTGVTFDTGNPCWTMEDPLVALEYVAPYVVTAHLRDSYVWQNEAGIAVQWIRFGQGNVRIADVVSRLHAAQPNVVMNLETICIGNRAFPLKQPDFWKGYEDVTAQDLMPLYARAETGFPLPDPPKRSREEAARIQLEDSDVSIDGFRKIIRSLGKQEA